MKRIVVTGANGFIGRHCIPLLQERGFEVYPVFSREVNLLKRDDVEWFMRKVEPSHLLHLAWITTPGVYWTSEENTKWVDASVGLIQLFRELGGQRVVVAGTCAEYDWTSGICEEEKTPLNPSSLYGQCKKELFSLLQGMNLNMAWGRIFFLYGPHEPEKKLVASVIRSLLKGEKAVCSFGDLVRDFLHVEDVARAFVALIENDIQGAINIGSGMGLSLKSICTKIGEKLGALERVEFGTGVARDAQRVCADVKRLDTELKWKPMMTLDEGLERTIQWWKSQR